MLSPIRIHDLIYSYWLSSLTYLRSSRLTLLFRFSCLLTYSLSISQLGYLFIWLFLPHLSTLLCMPIPSSSLTKSTSPLCHSALSWALISKNNEIKTTCFLKPHFRNVWKLTVRPSRPWFHCLDMVTHLDYKPQSNLLGSFWHDFLGCIFQSSWAFHFAYIASSDDVLCNRKVHLMLYSGDLC